jgi:hypothetical protein
LTLDESEFQRREECSKEEGGQHSREIKLKECEYEEGQLTLR